MKKIILSLIYLVIMALICCGKKQKITTDTPSTNPVDSIIQELYKEDTLQKKRVPHVNWNEGCNATFKNKNGTLKIWGYKKDNDTIQFTLTTAGEDMCTGEMQKFAIINGEMATCDVWYESEYCGIYFKFDGKKTIQVEEETNCLAYHGEACPFAGIYKK